MVHAVLHGEHELTLDQKNRVLIPIDVRRSLLSDRDGDAFYLVIGRNRRPWLYTQRYYEQLVSRAQQDLSPNEDLLAFDQFHFAMTSLLEMDKQARVLLPEKILARTGIGREITMIGVRDHLEIWNRADWEARITELLNKQAEVEARAQAAREASKPSS